MMQKLDDMLAAQEQIEEQIKEVFEKKELTRNIRRSAMDLLARREHSAHELQQKLETRFGYSPLISQQIEKLSEEGLQSDQRFCEAFLASRARKGKGPVRIRHELKQKQVSEQLISQQFRLAEIDWFESAKQVRIQKYGEAKPQERSDWAKQAKFLQYRGFDMDCIHYALGDC